MSAGIFTIARYAADYATNNHPIRVQPETLDATADSGVDNASADAAGRTFNPISAVSSRGRRSRGLIPRQVTLQFPLTGAPTGYKPGGITSIPALNSSFYADCEPGSTVTYLGVNCTVVGRSPELVR